jgi:hypothetical protein
VPYGCRRFLTRGRGIKPRLRVILAALAGSAILLSLSEMAGAQFKMPDQKTARPHITSQLVHLNFSQLPATAANGQMYYVNDGAPGTPCIGGGTGAVATRDGGVWNCGPIPGGTGKPSSVSCSHQGTFVGEGVFTAESNNNAGRFTTPNTSTDIDNCTVTFSTPAPAARQCIWSATNADASATVAGLPDSTTSTTAKVDFPSAGSNTAEGPLTIGYICF